MLCLARTVGSDEKINFYINYNECRALCDLVEELGGSPRLLDTIRDRMTIELVREVYNPNQLEVVVGIKAPMHVEILRNELDRRVK